MKNLEHTYSNNIHNSSIAILGIYPPPLGGVSVHIQRVMRALRKQKNSVYFFSTEPRYRYKLFPIYLFHLFIWLIYQRPKHVHYHSVYLSNSIAELVLLVALKKVMHFNLLLVEHDPRHMYKRSKRFKKVFNRLSAFFNSYILIGTITKKSYEDNQIKIVKTSVVEGAFLPPNVTDEKTILASYSPHLFSFLIKRSPLLLINASRLILLDSKDLYGIDVTINVLATLLQKNKKAGLIIALSEVNNHTYFKKLQSIIKEKKLQDAVYCAIGQQELWPLIKRVHLFVRPSLSDGASVSVQEADYFNIPIVASDVCRRPKQATLFKTGDMQDFTFQCQKALSSTASNSCNLT